VTSHSLCTPHPSGRRASRRCPRPLGSPASRTRRAGKTVRCCESPIRGCGEVEGAEDQGLARDRVALTGFFSGDADSQVRVREVGLYQPTRARPPIPNLRHDAPAQASWSALPGPARQGPRSARRSGPWPVPAVRPVVRKSAPTPAGAVEHQSGTRALTSARVPQIALHQDDRIRSGKRVGRRMNMRLASPQRRRVIWAISI